MRVGFYNFPDEGSPLHLGLRAFAAALRACSGILDPQLLDQEGTELVLIGADEDVPRELGIELQTENENLDSAELFKDLELDRSRYRTKPLTEGQWQ